MRYGEPLLHKVGIIYNQDIPSARQLGEQLLKYLLRKVVSVWLHSLSEEKVSEQIQDTNVILSIGGDGTILRIARSASLWNVPIIGINLGTVGFLTEISASEALERIPLFLKSKTWIDERTMLQAELNNTKNTNQKNNCLYALNDVVISRRDIPRLIHITATIDDTVLTTYKTDGVIVSTATGSTAYSLANRGPIIYPQSRDILLLPISPYMSMSHPLVLPSSSVIELNIQAHYEGVLSIDGQININLPENSVIKIKRSPYVTRLLRVCTPHSFYRSLEQKLKEK